MIQNLESYQPIENMAQRLREWHFSAGRHDLPWQHQGPYATWISEVMLQQTQVAVVIPYYLRFMEAFPTVQALADASLDRVLAHWAGLGYYARARHLHQAAQQVVTQFGGEIPQTIDGLLVLKGIGRSTAGAIRSLGWGLHGVIQDGNVRRVLARLHAIEGDLLTGPAQRILWDLADHYTPVEGPKAAVHAQAMMDLGALVCTRRSPQCAICPFENECQASREGLTQLLPTPRKTTVKPTVEWFVLGLKSPSGGLWCVRRAETGIWGGLYCPPTGISLSQLLSEAGLPLDIDCVEGPSLNHAFSHFSVHLRYVEVLLTENERPNSAICVTREAYDIGLPAPIKRLLEWD